MKKDKLDDLDAQADDTATFGWEKAASAKRRSSILMHFGDLVMIVREYDYFNEDGEEIGQEAAVEYCTGNGYSVEREDFEMYIAASMAKHTIAQANKADNMLKGLENAVQRTVDGKGQN